MNEEVWGMNKRLKNITMIALSISTILCGCTTAKDADNHVTQEQTINYTYNHDLYEKSVSNSAAFTDNGFIFLTNGILYFYDMTDNEAVPMCPDMTCSHKDSKCKAFAADKMDYDPYDLNGVSVNCLGNMVWYKDNHIYMIKRDESGDYLMEYDENFNNESKVACLASDGKMVGIASANTSTVAAMHENYLYYYSVQPTNAQNLVEDDYNTKVSCNRIAINGNSKVEELGSFIFPIDYELFNMACCKVCVGDKCVYYIAGGDTRYGSKNTPVQYRIYRYDIYNGKFEEKLNINTDNATDILGSQTGIISKVTYITADDNDSLYIVTDNKRIIKVSVDGKTEEIYNNPEALEISSLRYINGDIYFYEALHNEGNIKAVNADKQVVWTCSFAGDGSSDGTFSGIEIKGIDNNNIYVGMQRNNAKGWKNNNIEIFDNKVEPYVNTYSVYAIDLSDKDMQGSTAKKIYQWSK